MIKMMDHLNLKEKVMGNQNMILLNKLEDKDKLKNKRKEQKLSNLMAKK